MDRAHERILGTILVGVGVALLLVTWVHAYSVLTHLPTSSTERSPQAAFAWTVSGFSVTLTDNSRPGSAPITTTFWSFADGNTSSTANLTHTYTKAGSYNVTLIVEDKNGNAAESSAVVHVGTGATGAGSGTPSLGTGSSLGSAIGNALGGTIGGAVTLAESFSLLLIMMLVGAAILRAGWNLITPKAETIQVRVKPKSLAVEGVGYSAMPPGAGPGAPPPS